MTLAVLLTAVVPAAFAPDTSGCAAAAQFLRTTQHMVAAVDADTLDDWRTEKRLAGCRVTAAGATPVGAQREAVQLYERLRAAGWTRTPDPADAPNEASLRFRHGAVDCLFNVNREALLNTDSEMRVNEQLVVPEGQSRYQVLVICVAALPAAPTDE